MLGTCLNSTTKGGKNPSTYYNKCLRAHSLHLLYSVLSLHEYLLHHASIEEPSLRAKALVAILIATNLNANITTKNTA